MDLANPLYDPFRRLDQYGDLGWKRQTPQEYLRLAIFGLLLTPLKFLGCFYFVALCYVVCRLSAFIPERHRAKLVARCGKLCARGALLSIGFTDVKRISLRDGAGAGVGAGAPQPAAIVGNHCSWIDILVHTSHSFPSFVARSNTQDMPLIGLISQHLHCVYVNREFTNRHGNKEGVSGQVRERMERAALGELPPDTPPLLLFPEGTTTNGRCLLPFKTGAFLAGVPVQPVVIKYAPGRVSPSWDSINAFWHLFLLFAQPTHSVVAYELPVYVPNDEEKRDPHLYAANVRAEMLAAGNFKPSDSSLVECRAYIALMQGRAPPPHSKAGRALAVQNGDAPEGKDSDHLKHAKAS